MSVKSETIEEKMARLTQLVAWFESDDFVLEDATKQFEAAANLGKEIENDLSKLKNKVNVLKQSFSDA